MDRFRLVEIRMELGMSQRTLAHLIETSRSTLSLAELGMRSLPAHSRRLLLNLRNQVREQSLVEISVEDMKLLRKEPGQKQKDPEVQRNRYKFQLDETERQLNRSRIKLQETERAILLFLRNKVKLEESNIYQHEAIITMRELILKTLPKQTKRAEQLEQKILRLSAAMDKLPDTTQKDNTTSRPITSIDEELPISHIYQNIIGRLQQNTENSSSPIIGENPIPFRLHLRPPLTDGF